MLPFHPTCRVFFFKSISFQTLHPARLNFYIYHLKFTLPISGHFYVLLPGKMPRFKEISSAYPTRKNTQVYINNNLKTGPNTFSLLFSPFSFFHYNAYLTIIGKIFTQFWLKFFFFSTSDPGSKWIYIFFFFFFFTYFILSGFFQSSPSGSSSLFF